MDTHLRLFLCTIAAFVLMSCGGGGGGGNDDTQPSSVQLSGTVAKLEKPGARIYVGLTTITKVLAIPTYRGMLGEASMTYAKSATVDPVTGAFALSLETEADWVLVLMGTNVADPVEHFVGYVDVSAGNPDALLLFPASSAAADQFDLGTVTPPVIGNVATTSSGVDTTAFSVTADTLASLAKNDDGFKSVKNFINNYSNGVYYTLRPDFKFRGSYGAINGNFADPADYVFTGYNFQLDSNSTELTIQHACNNPETLLELLPPNGSGLTKVDNVGATCVPDQNDGTIEARGTDFFATDRYEHISYSLGDYSASLGPIPAGEWVYQVASVEKGRFDAAVAPPVDGTNTYPKGIIPVPKVNTDGSGKITSVSLAWYQSNDSGGWDPITDKSVLRYLIGTGDVYFDSRARNDGTYESVHFDPAADSSVVPTQTWYLATDGSNANQALGIGIFYYSAGIGHFFEFHAQF